MCKVKGFPLNFDNSQILNLESMKDAMFNRNEPGVGNDQTKNPSKICREKIQSEIYRKKLNSTPQSTPNVPFRQTLQLYHMITNIKNTTTFIY